MPTQTTTSGPPSWMQPYYQNFLQGATQVANRPYQQYQGPRVAPMSQIQQGALSGIQGAMFGNPATWAGMGLLGDIIGEGDNPYVDQIAGNVTADASKAFDSKLGQLNEIFSNPNSFGSDRHALGAKDLSQDFGKGLGSALSNLRYSAFDTGRNRQMQAANQAQMMNSSQINNLMSSLNAGGIPRGIQQQQYDVGYQDWRDAFNYPRQQSDDMARWLGMGGQVGQQSSTSTPDPNRTSQLLGGGLLLANSLGNLFKGGNSGGWASAFTGSNGNPLYTGYGFDGSYVYG